jgi:hypothetical protein
MARDGVAGYVRDLHFDEATWQIGYVEIDTGRWLFGRRVLAPSPLIGVPAWHSRVLPFSMTREQVSGCPSRGPAMYSSQDTLQLANISRAPNLRSVWDVLGYRLFAVDGEIGSVEDLVVLTSEWSIQFIIVSLHGLEEAFAGISPGHVVEADWDERALHIGLGRKSLQEIPEFDPASPPGSQSQVRWHGSGSFVDRG